MSDSIKSNMTWMTNGHESGVLKKGPNPWRVITVVLLPRDARAKSSRRYPNPVGNVKKNKISQFFVGKIDNERRHDQSVALLRCRRDRRRISGCGGEAAPNPFGGIYVNQESGKPAWASLARPRRLSRHPDRSWQVLSRPCARPVG